MTPIDVAFRYGKQPGPEELRAIDALREVYGVRRVSFNEKDSTVRVEFDASRMKEDTIAGLLRRAGIDLTEKLALA
jgi:copper chaperone CopZ